VGKISSYSENTTPSLSDFALGETASGPSTNRFKWLNILSLFSTNQGTWQTWTPSYTNVTVGNGTESAKYVKIGNYVSGKYILTLGSSSAIGSAAAITLPTTPTGDYIADQILGNATFIDTGNAVYIGIIAFSSPNTVIFRTIAVTTTIPSTPINFAVNAKVNATQNLTSTAPFTWGTGDSITCNFFYEST
jgi:hypothetical protein